MRYVAKRKGGLRCRGGTTAAVSCTEEVDTVGAPATSRELDNWIAVDARAVGASEQLRRAILDVNVDVGIFDWDNRDGLIFTPLLVGRELTRMGKFLHKVMISIGEEEAWGHKVLMRRLIDILGMEAEYWHKGKFPHNPEEMGKLTLHLLQQLRGKS